MPKTLQNKNNSNIRDDKETKDKYEKLVLKHKTN